jgi:hypothetical protein
MVGVNEVGSIGVGATVVSAADSDEGAKLHSVVIETLHSVVIETLHSVVIETHVLGAKRHASSRRKKTLNNAGGSSTPIVAQKRGSFFLQASAVNKLELRVRKMIDHLMHGEKRTRMHACAVHKLDLPEGERPERHTHGEKRTWGKAHTSEPPCVRS